MEKKNSEAGYILKKLMVSKTSEKTMPAVVRTAIVEEPISRARTKFSLTLRARILGWIRISDQAPSPSAQPSTTTVMAMWLYLALCR